MGRTADGVRDARGGCRAVAPWTAWGVGGEREGACEEAVTGVCVSGVG
jgi:hypothetical protein